MNIGFMQGRLSPMIDNKIQAFPWESWEDEFYLATQIDLYLMEWTLDQENLYKNPLMTSDGQKKIKDLCGFHKIKIPSLTGDCFMQAPFWKAKGDLKEKLEADFLNITNSASKIGIEQIIVPLVDNGSIENKTQEDIIVKFFESKYSFLLDLNIKVLFESDMKPKDLKKFIERFNSKLIGINYDIGNSAALGFSPDDEFYEYGTSIKNVHVKDRLYNGSTVPLGKGNANFLSVFKNLAFCQYKGNYILQTARATDGNHSQTLQVFTEKVKSWLN